MGLSKTQGLNALARQIAQLDANLNKLMANMANANNVNQLHRMQNMYNVKVFRRFELAHQLAKMS